MKNMPSNKIKDAKRKRRIEKQHIKKYEFSQKYDNSDICRDITAYIRAFVQAKKNVSWKPSI